MSFHCLSKHDHMPHPECMLREGTDASWQRITHLLPGKLHLDVGVHQVPILPDKGLLDIGHNAGVHLGQALSPEDPHIEPGPLALRWNPLW